MAGYQQQTYHQKSTKEQPSARKSSKNQKNIEQIIDSFSSKWITAGIDESAIIFMEDAGDFMSPKGKDDKKALSSSQIRNVFGELKRIQMKGLKSSKSDFLLLKPKVAYAAKRKSTQENDTGMELFKAIFDRAYQAVNGVTNDEGQDAAFANMCSLFEGIIAYHKYYGGK